MTQPGDGGGEASGYGQDVPPLSPPAQPPFGGGVPPAPPPPDYGAPPSFGYVPPPGELPGPYNEYGAPLSGWWKRFFALLIDSIVLAIPSAALMVGIMALTGSLDEFLADPSSGESSAMAPAAIAALLGTLLLVAVLQFLYFAAMNGSARGQTVGKMALKIRVRDAQHGGPIGFGRGALRELLPALGNLVCSLIVLLDGLAPLWDQRKQAWHDKMANSVVVDVSSSARR